MDLVLIHPRHPETPSRHCLDGVRMGSESVWGCINSININSFNLIPNLVAKNYDRPWYSYIAFITLYCIKMHISWGVWIMSGGVCMGSEFVWGCINTMLVKMYIGYDSSDIAFSSSARWYVKTPMSGGCLDGVCGCLTVSGSYFIGLL